jgi:hypothetical protein
VSHRGPYQKISFQQFATLLAVVTPQRSPTSSLLKLTLKKAPGSPELQERLSALSNEGDSPHHTLGSELPLSAGGSLKDKLDETTVLSGQYNRIPTYLPNLEPQSPLNPPGEEEE